MNQVMPYLIALALLATVGALVLGMVALGRGGEFNRRYGNLFMRIRIACQAFAVLLLAILAVWSFGR